MRRIAFALVLSLSGIAFAQTAEELVAKNLAAKGGEDKIKAIKTLKFKARYQEGDGFTAQVHQEAKAPNQARSTFSLQGMDNIQAYDGSVGWQINPFEGRRDAELLGEDDMRDIVEDSDFYGPLVDAKEKGETIEYMGHATIDGDDSYKLKVTLKNGDIYYFYLDPDTFLEFRTERQQFVRGQVRETFNEFGSYKQVNGVYMPFVVTTGRRKDLANAPTITYTAIEANAPLDAQIFKMPATPVAQPAAKAAEGSDRNTARTKKAEPPKPPATKPPQQ
ncbi:MAG: hypothetical protein HYX28_09630 [Candidatus Koribacter versatilis]|uniref:Outer membrane lipoprotein-sorting protein n=1 Tax=Candidatus Korobacter versatilis TaxID=658062 RepID=A0A932AB68_9BACT|nr:hypothetical protein [Candidatus Koribacter versatilis]